MLKQIFFNAQNQLRNGCWVALFFVVLAVFLFPLLLLAQHYKFELAAWLQAGLIIIVTLILQKMRREKLADVLGAWRLARLNDIARGFFLGALLMLVPALLLYLSAAISFSINSPSLTLLLTAAFTYLGGAVAEELLFRGFIFVRLIAGLGLVPAQLLISAYFVLTHLNNPGMQGTTAWFAGINIFIASLLFGYLYWRTRSVLMPIAMHFAANWVQGYVLGFGVSGNAAQGLLSPQMAAAPIWLSGGEFGLEASVPGLLMVSALLLLCWWKRQWLGSPLTTAGIR